MNAPLRPCFGPKWFEAHICSKVSELRRSTADKTAIGGIKNLNQLVRLHRELTGIGFRQMDAEFRMAISVQKAVVDSHCSANRKVASTPMMSGPNLAAGVETFAIQKIATKDHKVSQGYEEDLYLVWEQDAKAFRCVKGGLKIITSMFPDLRVAADEVTDFICSKESTKVLIKSTIDVDMEVSLFIKMANVEAVPQLFDQLHEHSSNDIDRHFQDSSDMDQIIAEFESMESVEIV
ncbi:MAG: hypothetical protein Q9208_004152 [Pyrenodesmia sp. 3 TL-2023]